MKLIDYDRQTGKVLGFYAQEIHGDNIPEGCIEISDEVWMHYLDNQGKLVIDITKKYNEEIINPKDIFIEATINIEDIKANKLAEFDASCQATIQKGFSSSATGTEHFYRFNKEEDQLNFNQQLSMIQEFPEDYPTIYWKTEDAGVLPHTQDQFKLVVKDASIHKNNNIQKYWNLKNQILIATSIEEVQAIVW